MASSSSHNKKKNLRTPVRELELTDSEAIDCIKSVFLLEDDCLVLICDSEFLIHAASRTKKAGTLVVNTPRDQSPLRELLCLMRLERVMLTSTTPCVIAEVRRLALSGNPDAVKCWGYLTPVPNYDCRHGDNSVERARCIARFSMKAKRPPLIGVLNSQPIEEMGLPSITPMGNGWGLTPVILGRGCSFFVSLVRQWEEVTGIDLLKKYIKQRASAEDLKKKGKCLDKKGKGAEDLKKKGKCLDRKGKGHK